MASFTIRPADREADAAAIAQTHFDAYLPFHEFYAAFFRKHPREIVPKATVKAVSNKDNIFFVAEDNATRQVIGFVRYNLEDPSEASDEEEGGKDNNKGPQTAADVNNLADPSSESLWAVKEHLGDLWKKVNEKEAEMDQIEEKASEGKVYTSIRHLMVSPAHQRRGVGTALMRKVISEANGQGLPIMITSSRESFHLYSKLGFEDLGVWTVDNAKIIAQVAERERELGLAGTDQGIGSEVEKMYEGTMEVEHCMIRRPDKTLNADS